MKAFSSYQLFIMPLSPIHIGTGDSYEPTNYVIEDGVLHEFDTGSVVEALSMPDRNKLLELASCKPDAEMIKALQRYFYGKRAALMSWVISHVPVLTCGPRASNETRATARKVRETAR